MDFDVRWLTLGVAVFNIFITAFGFALIKFNDFRHLTKDVEKLSSKIDKIDEKLDKHESDIAVLKVKIR